VAPGTSSAARQVALSCMSCAIAVNVQVNPSGSPATWLRVSTTPSGGQSSFLNNVQVTGSGKTIYVTINASGQQLGTNLAGSFTISTAGNPSGTFPVTVNVSATVGSGSSSGVLFSVPSSLSFTAAQGANVGNPTSTSLQIYSNGAQLNYFSNASTTDNGNWLLLQNPNGTSGGSTPITVFVNPSLLQPGNYNGTITAQSTSTTDFVQIPVSLTVTAGATLSVTPTTLPPFLFQVGQGLPASQQVLVSSTGGTINFSAAASNANWLIISPTSGSAGTNVPVTLSVNTNNLGVGSYTTQLLVTPQGGASLAGIPVKLVVSNNPPLKLSSNALSYSAQFAGTSPPDQQVQVTTGGTGTSVGFSVSSDSGWLSASPTSGSASSGSPANLTVHVNQGSMQIGNYTGTITVTPTNGDNYTQTITVSLAVTTASQLVAGPPLLLYSYQTTLSTPQPQLVQITSLGQQTSFNVSTSTNNCGTGWIVANASGFTTPATLTISLLAGNFVSGTCTGAVNITYGSGNGNSTLSIPVTVNIASSALLNVSFPSTTNGFGLEIVPQGSGGISRNISLTSTDQFTGAPTAISFNAGVGFASGPGNWLSVVPNFGSTPQSLLVQIFPAALAAGTYTGTIQITSSGLPSGTLSIPITLIVNPSVTVTVSPSSLGFTQGQNGPTPAAQNLTLTSSGGSGATFTATASVNQGSANWLSVSPSSGAASGQVTVSLVPSVVSTLSQGTYTGQINFAFQNSAMTSASIPVSLTITQAQTVSVAPSSLSFSYTVGSTTNPPTQTLAITSTGGPVNVSIGSTSTGGSWLSTTPASGATPQTVTVTANPQGLAAGTYNGTVSITATGVLASAIQVPVTFTIQAAPTPVPATILGNASNVAGSISAGELIVIKGTNLGPATGVSYTLNSQGGLDPKLSGVRVLFDGIPGTPYYVSATQINVTVPWELAGRLSTNIVVEYNGVQAAGIQQIVAAAAPGIFTLDTSGSGQAWVRNLSDGSINGPSSGVTTPSGSVQTKPATPGSFVYLIATGGGQTTPPGTTGSLTPGTAIWPLVGWTATSGTVSATIGGVNAPVVFAGAFPGLLTGLVQINLQVPQGVSGNALPIVITINGVQSRGGPTVSVQ
jgi:uncharacterized protein (TIGR03437 family)